MEQDLVTFEKKILDFLKGYFNQQFAIGNQTKIETKRLSKTKNDIMTKITSFMDAFMLLSELIKISNIVSKRVSNNPDKYIRENYSSLSHNIIKSTHSFDLVGEEDILQYFKNIQRNFTHDVFSLVNMHNLFDIILVFHPEGITLQYYGNNSIYNNTDDVKEVQYRNSHKKYYRDLIGILVESGIKEIKNNLHPEKNKSLINNLDLTVNMIKKLDYHVDDIEIVGNNFKT